MFDLSVKEKPRSPFRRLRDKMKGKHSYDLDSSSAIVPSSTGALDDDFRPGPPKDKARGSFFFKGQLRRSSLTRSSTSLGSASTLSSASSLGALGSTEGGAPSPSRHSSFSTDPAGRDFLPSPQLTHKRAFSDEVGQINLLPEALQGLKTPKDPPSGSSLCINGSHIYCEEPSSKPSFLSLAPFPPGQSEPGKQERGSEAGPPAAQPELPPWTASDSQKGPPKDLPRFIPSPPILAAQEEDKLSVKTIALNKQRVRARREEGLQAESKPVPMAAPLAFPSEVRRVRPQDERDQRGSLRGHGQSPEPHLEAPSGEKEEPQSGSRISPRDPREPARRPSSQPGLPATPELSKDPWVVSEDQGLPPSIPAGEAQPSSLAPPARRLQPPPPAAAAAAPTRPPVEGDDGFAAFAASRLQPAAPGPEPPPATDPPGGAAGLLPQQEEGPPIPERASQGSPDWLSLAYVERGRAWSGSGGLLLVRGTFGEGANSAPNASSLREEQAPGEAAFAQNMGRLGSSVPLAPDVPAEALSWTPESCPRNRTIPSLADPSSEQLDWDREQQTLPQSQAAPQAESSEPSWLPWDPQREEDVGVEEAAPTSGGPAQEEQRGPAETEGPRGAGTPPPKPSRRVLPLQLTKEASGAGRGTLESAQPRGADPEPPPHLPPVGVAGSPPAAAVSLVPAVIIGAGAPEGLPLAAAEALLDDQPGGQEEPSGATILAAEEGPSAEALQFSTCSSQLSLGGLGLSGVPESPRQDGETGFAPWGLEGAWPTGLPGSASLWSSERFPQPPEASQGPPEPSPSLLFWSALEEPRGLPGEDTSLESPCGLGQDDGATGLPPLPPGQEPEAPSGGPNDQARDFRKASFWQEGRGEAESKQEDSPLTPGNPFAPWATPSPQKNPFVERPPAAEVPWAQAVILPVSPTVDAHSLGEIPAATDPPRQPRSHNFSVELPGGPSRPGPPRPLAFSTPSFQPVPSPTDCSLPSPLGPIRAGAAADGHTEVPPLSPLLSPPSMDASAPSVQPTEMLPAQDTPRQQTPSPHPVKPMRSTPAPESPRKETAGLASSPSHGQITGQEQLAPMSAISGTFAASVVPLEKMEAKQQSPSTKYHHLTREELLQLLLRREAELGKKEEQVRELEGYIDRLLVRIMEQSPTLLQIPLEDGGVKATQ